MTNVKDFGAYAFNLFFGAMLLVYASMSPVLAEEYTLDTGDVLAVQLLENPQINGNYTIGATGEISIPGLGRISARGETEKTFEWILQRWTAQTIVDPSLSVYVAQYRPFSILGEVSRPGSYPYVPGMTVMQAVAVARGFGRTVDGNELSSLLANLNAQKSLDGNVVQLAQAEVRLERLKAELDGLTEFSTKVAANLTSNELAQIFEQEQRLITERTNDFNEAVLQAERTLVARKDEVKTYQEQIALQQELISAVTEQLNDNKDLFERELIPKSRLNEMVQTEINARNQILQTTSLLRGAQTDVSQAELSLTGLKNGRRVELASKIRDMTGEVTRLKKIIRADKTILAQTGGARKSASAEGKSPFVFQIYRKGKLISEDADLATPITPDDTIFVLEAENG